MDGTEVGKVEIHNKKPYGPEFELKEFEEIIGVYGVITAKAWIRQLGFIIWTPPTYT